MDNITLAPETMKIIVGAYKRAEDAKMALNVILNDLGLPAGYQIDVSTGVAVAPPEESPPE